MSIENVLPLVIFSVLFLLMFLSFRIRSKVFRLILKETRRQSWRKFVYNWAGQDYSLKKEALSLYIENAQNWEECYFATEPEQALYGLRAGAFLRCLDFSETLEQLIFVAEEASDRKLRTEAIRRLSAGLKTQNERKAVIKNRALSDMSIWILTEYLASSTTQEERVYVINSIMTSYGRGLPLYDRAVESFAKNATDKSEFLFVLKSAPVWSKTRLPVLLKYKDVADENELYALLKKVPLTRDEERIVVNELSLLI